MAPGSVLPDRVPWNSESPASFRVAQADSEFQRFGSGYANMDNGHQKYVQFVAFSVSISLPTSMSFLHNSNYASLLQLFSALSHSAGRT
jgi:hypothetical protein